MSHGLSIQTRHAQNVCNRTRLWILRIEKSDEMILCFSVSQWTQHVSWEWCDNGELRILCSRSSSSLLFFDFPFSQRASKKIAFAFSLLVIVGICSVVGVLGSSCCGSYSGISKCLLLSHRSRKRERFIAFIDCSTEVIDPLPFVYDWAKSCSSSAMFVFVRNHL